MVEHARPSGGELARRLVQSARGDAPPRGARARAIARLADAPRGGIFGEHLGGVVLAAAVAFTMASGLLGQASVPPMAAPAACISGVEVPAGACAEVSDRAVWSPTTGGSSSGLAGCSGSGG